MGGLTYFFKILALVCLISGALHAEGAYDCRHLYGELSPSGAPWMAHAGVLTAVNPYGSQYRLGDGQGGGTVYRIVPHNPTANTFLKKVYRRQMQRDADAELMEMFGQAYGNAKSPFRIPQVKRVGTHELELEETPGRDLHSLLMDPSISPELKEQLRTNYNRRLKDFSAFLFHGPRIAHSRVGSVNRDFFADGKPDGTDMFESTYRHGEPNQISILIKSDNVIVHWVGGDDPFVMTLIDPY